MISVSISNNYFIPFISLHTVKHLNVSKRLVKYYIWSTALYGAENWTLRKVDHNHMENFEMWCWRIMEIT